jgi:glyoxylase-like metal-dependent hydrolase (beta-lactamase superfamily II)
MDTVELRPGLLYMFRFSVGQAYLWRDAKSLTLIDTGPPGSAPDIAAALTQLGLQAGDLDRILLTHFHADHIGSAAELAAHSGASTSAVSHSSTSPPKHAWPSCGTEPAP